jgi:hypothetical protein
MGTCLGSTGDDASVECGVRLKIAAEVGSNVPVHCHDEFASYQIVIFLVICGKLHHRDIIALINKNGGLQCGLVAHNHGAQFLVDKKKTMSSVFVLHPSLKWWNQSNTCVRPMAYSRKAL